MLFALTLVRVLEAFSGVWCPTTTLLVARIEIAGWTSTLVRRLVVFSARRTSGPDFPVARVALFGVLSVERDGGLEGDAAAGSRASDGLEGVVDVAASFFAACAAARLTDQGMYSEREDESDE